VAEGVFDILSEPEDLDMTSRSLVDDVRADLERLMLGFSALPPSSRDFFLLSLDLLDF
jgi:hypothetical protein